MMKYAVAIIATLAATSLVAATHLKQVKVSFVEALDPKDTTSSKRFQEDYESAITLGQALTAAHLKSCGYELKTETSFYGASDPINAKEKAEEAVRNGAWLIVGPRRSNHYMLLAKGAEETPTVSLMASSDSLAELGPLHLSLAPTNSLMAKAAAQEAKRQSKGSKSYVSFVARDCMNCRDFSEAFDKDASVIGLKKSAEIFLIGDQPEIAPLQEAIRLHKPAFVLLPNYSILSSYIVSNLAAEFKDLFFVGADGWGDSKFGFVQNGPDISSAKGFSARGNPPVVEGLKAFALGQKVTTAGKHSKIGSSSSLSILRIFDALETSLCRIKPKDKVAFKKDFAISGARDFSNPWGVSIYEINHGQMTFARASTLSSKSLSKKATKQ